MWPVFASVKGFRKFHATHHNKNLQGDGNCHIWYTHNAGESWNPLGFCKDAQLRVG